MNASAAKRYLRSPYARIVIPDGEGAYHAEILEFPGCYAQGDSPQEAYSNLEEAAQSWIEVCLEKGQPVPEPSSSLGFSGHMLFRMPRSVHRRAARMAERDRTSLNQYVLTAVSASVGADELCELILAKLGQHLENMFTWFPQDNAVTPGRVSPSIEAQVISGDQGAAVAPSTRYIQI